MSAPVSGWTFFTLVAGAWVAQTKTARAFDPLQIQDTIDLPSLVRQFNNLWKAVRAATIGGRSLPFGPLGSVYEAVHFTRSVALSLPHNLGTPRVRALGWPLSGSIDPGTQAVSSDGGSIVLTPSDTFVADVVLVVFP
jgi:hypothetical protein